MGTLEKFLEKMKNPPVLTARQVRLRSPIFFALAIFVYLGYKWVAETSGSLYMFLPVLSVALVLLGLYALITGRLPNSPRR